MAARRSAYEGTHEINALVVARVATDDSALGHSGDPSRSIPTR